jgi:negative regulator of sigma E activity
MNENDDFDREHDGNRDFERRARALFEASVENLDASTRSRLNRSRQQALALAKGERTVTGTTRRWSWWMPAGAIAASVLAAVLMWREPVSTQSTAAVQANASGTPTTQEPLDMLAANADDLQLAAAEDDLDFYAWADDTTDGGAGAGEGQT